MDWNNPVSQKDTFVMVKTALDWLGVVYSDVMVEFKVTVEDPDDFAEVETDHLRKFTFTFYQQAGKPLRDEFVMYLVVHECLHCLMAETDDALNAAAPAELESTVEAFQECYVTKMAWTLMPYIFPIEGDEQ